MTETDATPLQAKFDRVTTSKTPAQTELELAQDRLRNMMMRKTLPEKTTELTQSLTAFETGEEPNIVARLINLALAGDIDFLSTALADEWCAPFSLLRPLIQRNDLATLSILLKGLEFGATDTFAIASAFNPTAFNSRMAIASFYVKFQAITDAEIHGLTQKFTEISGAQNTREIIDGNKAA